MVVSDLGLVLLENTLFTAYIKVIEKLNLVLHYLKEFEIHLVIPNILRYLCIFSCVCVCVYKCVVSVFAYTHVPVQEHTHMN